MDYDFDGSSHSLRKDFQRLPKLRQGKSMSYQRLEVHAVENTGQKPLEYILVKSPIPLQLPPYTSEFFEPIERYTAKAKPLKEIVKTKNPD